LIGYKIHRPNLGGYEYNCPSILLENERPQIVQAKDHIQQHYLDLIDKFRVDENGNIAA
jgi:hypothetical protein